MDKRTVIAVVASVVIISATFAIQSIFFSGDSATTAQEAAQEQVSTEVTGGESPTGTGQTGLTQVSPILADVEDDERPREITYSTNAFQIVFNTRGGSIQSLRLRQFTEVDGSLVEMILSEDSDVYPVRLFLDDYITDDDIFTYSPGALPDMHVFSKRYIYRDSGKETPFTVSKIYRFKQDEHLFEIRVNIETESGAYLPIQAYTLSFGPQIGPEYEKLDGRNEFRRYIYLTEGKRKDYSRKVRNTRAAIDDRITWLAIEGKYFLVAGISYVSDLSKYRAGFDTIPLARLSKDRSSLYFDRTFENIVEVEDGYKFYIGPKKRDVLERYSDVERNEFGESGLQLEKAIPYSFWGWLSAALKWLLELFYRLIPNWGVAIILLTILIKVVFFPLTKKSLESTSKMQNLGPKIQVIKEKFKDNSQKMNQEIAALYKKEGVNPLGGCLPILIQMPILFAFFQLFNTYFEFRGAAFIPPWIADLSAPEQILTLPFTIPLLNWSELRILPFFMLGTTFLQQLTTKNPGQSSSQNKLLMYGLPLIFFFIFYNMPSGLLLYWTVQSLLSYGQQLYVNYARGKKQAK